MNIQSLYSFAIGWPAAAFDRLRDVFVLVLRIYVGWQFFNAGLLKLGSWSNTLFLFEYEYRVPLLSPYPAAVLGTAGEIVFPVLLWLGLTSRLAAVGMQAVNVMAVVAYAHVIFNPEFGTGAAADHYLWGLMILVIMLFGPGRISADAWLSHYRNGRTQPVEANELGLIGRLQS